MSPEQMQKRSAEKVQQIVSLMKTLHIRQEVRRRLDKNTGFIEDIIFWMDDESYPTPPGAVMPQGIPPAEIVPIVDPEPVVAPAADPEPEKHD